MTCGIEGCGQLAVGYACANETLVSAVCQGCIRNAADLGYRVHMFKEKT